MTPAAVADDLIRRRALPLGGTVEMRAMSDGWPLRTMRWLPGRDSPGSILFMGGRADFIEKYSEALWHWSTDWRAGLMTFDWRGQGLSGRLGRDSMHGHAAGFDRWVEDLGAMVGWFVETMPGPHVAIGHSMGGHLLMRHLARAPSPLARAALLAPMFGIRTGIPVGPLAKLAVALGAGGRFGPLQRPYGPWQQREERHTLLTSDPERFSDEHWWIAENPRLALGGVTWGWLAAATRSLATLNRPGALESVQQPVLALSGNRERLVVPEATERAMKRLPHGTFEIVPRAAHELLRETPAIQQAVQARLRAFLFGAAR